MVWSLRNIFDAKSAKGDSTELALIGKKEPADPATNTDGQDTSATLTDTKKSVLMKIISDNFWMAVLATLVLMVLILYGISIRLTLYSQKNAAPFGKKPSEVPTPPAYGPHIQSAVTGPTTYEPRPPSTTTYRPLPRTPAKTVPPPRRYAPGSQRARPAPPSDSPFDKKGKPTEPPTMIEDGGTIDTTGHKTVKDAATMGNSTEATNANDSEMTTTGPILVEDTTVENGEMTTAGPIPVDDTTVENGEMTTAGTTPAEDTTVGDETTAGPIPVEDTTVDDEEIPLP